MMWIVAACFLGVLVSIVLGIQNNRVYRFLVDVNDKISAAASRDIRRDLPWKWRYEEFDKVSQSAMVFAPWKPLRSWFKPEPWRPDRAPAQDKGGESDA